MKVGIVSPEQLTEKRLDAKHYLDECIHCGHQENDPRYHRDGHCGSMQRVWMSSDTMFEAKASTGKSGSTGLAGTARELTLEAIQKIWDRATPGPWEWWTSNSWRRLKQVLFSSLDDMVSSTTNVLEPVVSRADGHPDLSISQADMDAIEAAPTHIVWLVDRVQKLEAELDEVRSKFVQISVEGQVVECKSVAEWLGEEPDEE